MSDSELFLEAGARMRELRGSLSQAEFAQRLGVDRKTVVRWEAGERLPDGKSLLTLSTVFDADLNYLLVGVRDALVQQLDSAERVLVDSYRRCNDQARQNLIQTAALLSAGLAAAPAAGGAAEQVPQTQHVRAKGAGAQAAGRNIINKRKK